MDVDAAHGHSIVDMGAVFRAVAGGEGHYGSDEVRIHSMAAESIGRSLYAVIGEMLCCLRVSPT